MTAASALPAWFPWLALAVLGLVIGSFLNVVIHRLPRMVLAATGEGPAYDRTLLWPGSACPVCDHPIPAHTNIPLLGMLMLGGHCAACRAPIAWRYPAVELAGAALPLLLALAWGFDARLAAGTVFAWTGLAVLAIDLEHRLIPDALSLPLLAAGLAANAAGLFVPPLSAAAAAAAGYALFRVVRAAGRRLAGREALGGGDVTLFAALGAWVGAERLPLLLLLAAGGGLTAALAMAALGRRPRDGALPFGPFLVVAGIVALVWGDALVQGYGALILP